MTSQAYEISHYANSVKLINSKFLDFSYSTNYFNFAEFQISSTTRNDITCITTSKGRWCHYDITYIIAWNILNNMPKNWKGYDSLFFVSLKSFIEIIHRSALRITSKKQKFLSDVKMTSHGPPRWYEIMACLVLNGYFGHKSDLIAYYLNFWGNHNEFRIF